MHQQIGALMVTMNRFKKIALMSLQERRKLVDCDIARQPVKEGGLSIVKQCATLEIHRNGLCFTPRHTRDKNSEIMRLIDVRHMDDPSNGTRLLTRDLADAGFAVGLARIRRLMQAMRIKAAYWIPRTTIIDATK